MNRCILIPLLLALALPLKAQPCADELRRDPALAAGIMAPYVFEEAADTPPPPGYKPFYISHFGRHGSRYHIPHLIQRWIPSEMIEARESGALTPRGEEALQSMLDVIALHDGVDGELSGLGAVQQHRLAERMYTRFRRVFASGGRVNCRSSYLPRCILSMASFGTALQKCCSGLDISYSAGQKDYEVLCHPIENLHLSHIYLDSLDAVRRPLLFDPSRLMKELFAPDCEVRDPQAIAKAMYHLGSVEAGIGRPPVIFGYFTDEELYLQWRLYSDWIYGDLANTTELGFRVLPSAKTLLGDFVSLADIAVNGGGTAADLRFGHDGGLLPLLCLMGVEGFDEPHPISSSAEFGPAHRIIPCAANLQLIFYRNRKGGVLIKLLYNEQERRIPALKAASGPYYDWNEVRQYWSELAK